MSGFVAYVSADDGHESGSALRKQISYPFLFLLQTDGRGTSHLTAKTELTENTSQFLHHMLNSFNASQAWLISSLYYCHSTNCTKWIECLILVLHIAVCAMGQGYTCRSAHIQFHWFIIEQILLVKTLEAWAQHIPLCTILWMIWPYYRNIKCQL